jgi:hypothetical protein
MSVCLSAKKRTESVRSAPVSDCQAGRSWKFCRLGVKTR